MSDEDNLPDEPAMTVKMSKDLAVTIPDDTLSLTVSTNGGIMLGMFRRNTKTKEWEFGVPPGSRASRFERRR